MIITKASFSVPSRFIIKNINIEESERLHIQDINIEEPQRLIVKNAIISYPSVYSLLCDDTFGLLTDIDENITE